MLMLVMLSTACAKGLPVPTKPVPCKVFSPPKPPTIANMEDIVFCELDGETRVCMRVPLAIGIDTYFERTDRFNKALAKCNIEFVEIGGGDSLKKVDWGRVNEETGKIGG